MNNELDVRIECALLLLTAAKSARKEEFALIRANTAKGLSKQEFEDNTATAIAYAHKIAVLTAGTILILQGTTDA